MAPKLVVKSASVQCIAIAFVMSSQGMDYVIVRP